MTIKDYMQIFLKRWWLLALSFGVVLGATYIWTAQQTPVYESHATFVIRPRSDTFLGNDYIRALDTISNRSEINSTFAEVASSKLVKSRAIERLNLSSKAREGLAVSATVINGANVIEVSVEAYDPTLAQDFANAVGEEMMTYTDALYDVYQVEALDMANRAATPIRPNIVLNMSMGALLGIALGGALIFLLEMLKPSYKEVDTFNIVDRETGAYNKSYLTHRLFQEMARTERTKTPLSLGMVKVHFNGDVLSDSEQLEALRMVKILTEKTIRREDLLARFNGVTFAILFPDLSHEQAYQTVENVRQAIGSVAHDLPNTNGHAPLKGYTSVVTYTGRAGMSQEDLVEQALESLNIVILQ
jgi:diguanylate cyclase (GGDEF)-like protein